MRIVALSVVAVCLASRLASAATDPAVAFTRKCSSCHTYGRGDLVGPDLKGVTDRHSRAWLTAWITSSATVIESGDEAASALFKKYKQQRMPDQSFSPSELAALIDYLAAGGPARDAMARNRRADSASVAEIELGRSLFAGDRPLTAGGASCGTCHRVGQSGRAGGSLGPDLTGAYSRFQDKRLATLLARGCFPRVPESGSATTLTEQESFALTAFLRQAGASPSPAERGQLKPQH